MAYTLIFMRLLDEGEIIKEGDEFLSYSHHDPSKRKRSAVDKWIPATFIGKKAQAFRYRRPDAKLINTAHKKDITSKMTLD